MEVSYEQLSRTSNHLPIVKYKVDDFTSSFSVYVIDPHPGYTDTQLNIEYDNVWLFWQPVICLTKQKNKFNKEKSKIKRQMP